MKGLTMESPEDNRTMTQVGKGTPGGELLRRYWHPIGATAEFTLNATKRVRLLGEDLVLFKDRQSRYGLIQEHCPHRRASFAYGFATEQGIRCPYHGWEFDAQGKCVNQPFERDSCEFRDKVAAEAYPVEELGGMLFAYLGPKPVPLLPRFDGFVSEGAIRLLGWAVIPCNWLQIVETSVDPVHAEWLHGRFTEYENEQEGLKTHISASHKKIDFREFEWGITKHRLLEGQSEEDEDWKVGHPIVFPTMLAVGNGDEDRRSYAFQMRVPMDDENTMHFWYHAYMPPQGAQVPPRLLKKMHLHEVLYKGENDRFRTDHIDAQDIIAWLTQGTIADRTKENLGASDMGVALYRKILKREIKKVQRGEDPIGVIRDPAKNLRIDLPNEKNKKHFRGSFRTFIKRTHVRFSPILEELGLVYEP
jgi:5,5'-dehydrodivanillate O-demethylase oxygenase subunit